MSKVVITTAMGTKMELLTIVRAGRQCPAVVLTMGHEIMEHIFNSEHERAINIVRIEDYDQLQADEHIRDFRKTLTSIP